eukprot:scaffold22766_cov131-Cylindrotheca_fusiformis.AAC.8
MEFYWNKILTGLVHLFLLNSSAVRATTQAECNKRTPQSTLNPKSTMAFSHGDNNTPIPFQQSQSFRSLKRKFEGTKNHNASASLVPSQAEVDALVARDMNELTGKEREQVLHDIHGVADFPDETPLEVERRLAELETQIQRVASKSAYQQALAHSEAYVKDRTFRLKFLRADLFNTRRAASRLVGFFEQKLLIFGANKLARDITLEDLDHDDLAVLNNGHMQFLPQKDMGGRSIFCDIRSRERFANHSNLLRALFYMLMAQAEDEEAQQKGIVGVVYNFSLLGDRIDQQAILRSAKLRNSLPIRFAAMHYCFNHPSFVDFINYERLSFDTHTRARCRAHKVSATDFHSELVSFGIAARSVPASLIGGLRTKSHQEWIHSRRKKELTSGMAKSAHLSSFSGSKPKNIPLIECEDGTVRTVQPSTQAKLVPNLIENVETTSDSGESVSPPPTRRVVEEPSPGDVLFGRGKVKEHPGNIRLHQLIEKRRSRYEVAEKWEKTVISEEIVAIIKECSGRFLRPTVSGEGWLEVDKEIAREKVSHTFRSLRPKIPKRRKIQGGGNRAGLYLSLNNRL